MGTYHNIYLLGVSKQLDQLTIIPLLVKKIPIYKSLWLCMYSREDYIRRQKYKLINTTNLPRLELRTTRDLPMEIEVEDISKQITTYNSLK